METKTINLKKVEEIPVNYLTEEEMNKMFEGRKIFSYVTNRDKVVSVIVERED